MTRTGTDQEGEAKMFIIGLLIGLVIGGVVGIVTMALCVASGKNDTEAPKYQN